MNKSTVERVTECRMVHLSRESWGLEVEGEVRFVNKGKKESIVFQKVHDDFWAWRRKQIMERDKYQCVNCGSRIQLSVDHKINRSQGGTHNPDNLQVLCGSCHHDKTNLSPRSIWSVK